MKHQLNVGQINETAKHRPKGYVQRVMALGVVSKDGKILQVKDYQGYLKLKEEYANLPQYRAANKAAPKTDKSVWGPRKWAKLHAAAKAGEITAEWLQGFNLELPCGECRQHWKQVLAEVPFRPDDQYHWSVDAHNAVNVRLGKPVWTP